MIIPKDRIYDFLKAIFIMTFIPIGFYLLIRIVFQINLNPVVYPVASITGFCIVLTTAWEKILRSETTKIMKIASFLILLIGLPIASIFLFDLVTPVGLTTENLAEAIFGWVFGICVGVGFTHLLPIKYRG